MTNHQLRGRIGASTTGTNPTTTKEKQMTDTLTKVVVDCSTGEQTILPLTQDEIASLELSRQESEARKAEEDAAAEALAAVKASAKAKLVAGTPLTEEEAATLVL